ncbi:MAG: DNA cytosine methyltransferase [Imperialibacter sp.]|uniref:DNA cytosine methyltransferase n=1 Tax=Imperialibacter sp. TaxID=2038411 RepID=UPI0032EF3DFB
MKEFTSLELCAGAGGQALGLEKAGFKHLSLVEIEPLACQTLRVNRPEWDVIQGDLRNFSAKHLLGKVDLVAGGVPCPPFSVAGKQLGAMDDRDLFPEAIRIITECNPKAIMLENVRGILDPKFKDYRDKIIQDLKDLGYECDWTLINSSDYGVSQLRPRAILIGLKPEYYSQFNWPAKKSELPLSVGEIIYEEMASLGWSNVEEWKKKANRIAPTLVGGSKKHGGADLGPSRARKAWAELAVDGSSLANRPPMNGFEGNPKLTLEMTALIQGFPKTWKFVGKKTPAYRQVGNAFPPPVAKEIGKSIIQALSHDKK